MRFMEWLCVINEAWLCDNVVSIFYIVDDFLKHLERYGKAKSKKKMRDCIKRT